MKKLMIIDGNSIVNRAFYAVRLLTTRDGTFTNAIYGFINILFKNIEEQNPDYLCVAFDLKGPTFRHKMYEGYKAQRKGMPEELAGQMPILKDVLSAMNISMLSLEGYEADDIIGTVAALCDRSHVECVIVTGDKDDLQLVGATSRVLLTTTAKGVTTMQDIGREQVIQKYGVTPAEFIDVKALMGDPSDNIPGVAGVGEKTALALIQEFHSIENLYENLDAPSIKKGVRDKLELSRDMAFLSKQLATIDLAVPLEIDIDSFERKAFNNNALAAILEKLEFRSLIKKLALTSVPAAPAQSPLPHFSAECLTTHAGLADALELVKQAGRMCYLLYTFNGEPDAIAWSVDGERCFYCEFGFVFNPEQWKDVFEEPRIKKLAHNAKEDMVLLKEWGIGYAGLVFDTQLGAYLIDPSMSGYDVSRLAMGFLGMEMPDDEAVLGKGKSRLAVKQLEDAAGFACLRLACLPALEAYIHSKLQAFDQNRLYYDVELPLASILADMQMVGFKVDREQLTRFSDMLSKRLGALELSIHELAGEAFNINSTKQLGVVLFERLGLPAGKKTKTGYSTDAEVLEKLSGKHEIIDLLMEYRQLIKLKSTYADGLLSVINPRTQRVHSNLNQTVTLTGRISSTEPNLQNIPVRLELGREVRRMFIPSDHEHVLVDADYSQIELRVLAHISRDKNMIDAFLAHEDIHTITASQVFGVPIDMVTPLMRGRAKAVNFGIVYGIGAFSLSQDLKISRKEAETYIQNYLETYSGVRDYMLNIVQAASEQGFVTTLLNRRRYIPELKSSNHNTRAFGERVALNTPIQGSAADIIKLAMVRVFEQIKARGLKSRLILQVHDELIVDAFIPEVQIVQNLLKEEMEAAFELSVPLVADVGSGISWYDAK